MLRSLDFAERTARESRVKSAQPETLAWLRRIGSGSAASFSDWLGSSQRIFWIQGKPGSGKSTLMKHLHHDAKTLDLLQGTNERGWITIPFFFDYGGHTGITNNFEGLLRSVLHDLTEHCPDETEGSRGTGSLGRRNDTVSRKPSKSTCARGSLVARIISACSSTAWTSTRVICESSCASFVTFPAGRLRH